jgi:hypothetical protein
LFDRRLGRLRSLGFRPRLVLIAFVSEMVAAALVTVIWLLLAGQIRLWPLILGAAVVGMGSLAVLIVLTDVEARQTAQAARQTLRGLIPICASCKKVRDDEGAWHPVEDYVHRHSEAEFTHGICPECVNRLYSSGVLEGSDRRDPPDRTRPDK